MCVEWTGFTFFREVVNPVSFWLKLSDIETSNPLPCSWQTLSGGLPIHVNQSYHIRLYLSFFNICNQSTAGQIPSSWWGSYQLGLISAEFLAQHVQWSQFPNTAILALRDASATFILKGSLLYQLCYRKSVFPGLFVTDCSLCLWLAIRCFCLNKQISSPSFPQDVLQRSTSDWDKMSDTYVFNKWHQNLFKHINKAVIELWLQSRF